jgi:hypothetical protein
MGIDYAFLGPNRRRNDDFARDVSGLSKAVVRGRFNVCGVEWRIPCRASRQGSSETREGEERDSRYLRFPIFRGRRAISDWRHFSTPHLGKQGASSRTPKSVSIQAPQ